MSITCSIPCLFRYSPILLRKNTIQSFYISPHRLKSGLSRFYSLLSSKSNNYCIVTIETASVYKSQSPQVRCFHLNCAKFRDKKKDDDDDRIEFAAEDGWGNRTFHQQTKRSLWQKEPKKLGQVEKFRHGFGELRTEIKLWQQEVKEKWEMDPIFVRPGDTDVFYDFREEETIKKIMVSCDSDHGEGYSNGSFTQSPNNCAIFKGFIDLRVPKDGRTKRAGYCSMNGPPARKSFKRDTYHDWQCYTHLTLRVRGDGRTFLINISTAGYFDVQWNDVYQYVLYTRGGPYWQDVKIPFSKFVFAHSGRAQDVQERIPLHRISRFGITAMDRITGPFSLEIDNVSLLYDPSYTEEFAYEMYKIPKFWII